MCPVVILSISEIERRKQYILARDFRFKPYKKIGRTPLYVLRTASNEQQSNRYDTTFYAHAYVQISLVWLSISLKPLSHSPLGLQYNFEIQIIIIKHIKL